MQPAAADQGQFNASVHHAGGLFACPATVHAVLHGFIAVSSRCRQAVSARVVRRVAGAGRRVEAQEKLVELRRRDGRA